MDNFKKLQNALESRGLDAMLLTSEQNCRYVSGFMASDMSCVVARDKAWYFTDSRYIEAASATITGAEIVVCGGDNPMGAAIKKALDDCGAERVGAEETYLPHGSWLSYEKKLERELIPAQDILTELRVIKEQEEVDSIIAAQRIAEQALAETIKIIRPGMTEMQVAAELEYRMRCLGGEGVAFETIAVTGAKSSMPHGVPGEEVLKEGDFLTLDFGCIKNGYRSDMTRTFAIGYATEEMEKVYNTVLQAQLAGIELAKAGVLGSDVHNAGAKVIGDAGYGEYFGHGFGHSLGLEVHENPRFSPFWDKPIPAGAILTAEPGIYLPGRFGVRIEDMILITDDGYINLTKAPKELTVIGK